MGEKGIHLRAAHLARMAQLVKAQKPPQPLLVGVHRSAGIVAHLQPLPVALDQAWWAGFLGQGDCAVAPPIRVPRPLSLQTELFRQSHPTPEPGNPAV